MYPTSNNYNIIGGEIIIRTYDGKWVNTSVVCSTGTKDPRTVTKLATMTILVTFNVLKYKIIQAFDRITM